MAAVGSGTVDRFVARCVDAAAGPHAAGEIERGLRQLVARPDDLLRALPGDDAEETVLHQSPALTVVRVDGPPGLAFPPHDHRMPALVGILAGEEANTYFRVGDDGLRMTGVVRVARGDVLRLGADVVHAISNAGAVRSIGIHVYLGDLFGTARSIWHPDTHERRPYSTTAYMALARPAGAHPPAERP